MIFYVKFDPISHSIVDYSLTFNEGNFFYLPIDLTKDYGNEITYIHQISQKNYRGSAISIPIKKIQKLLLEKIRQDKLDFLIK